MIRKRVSNACVESLTALVEPVDSDDVVLAHLSRCAQRSIIIRNGNHSGQAILRESISNRASDINSVCLQPGTSYT